MKTSICEIVREAEQNYLNGSVQMGEYVEWDMHDTIEKIDAYLNSKHISGSQDSLGRDKPFFNIVTAAVNIWYRATDLDRKNIRILPDTHKDTALAFVATVLLQEWMKKSRFAVFLNEWGRTLARYGSAVCKFVEKDGELIASVVPWNRMIVDPIDFDALPRIEKVYKTPSQLRKMTAYDQEVVERLIAAQQPRETLDGQNQDNQSNFIEVYEVHGELSLALLAPDIEKAKDSEWENYRQQMHVVSFVETEKGEYEDFTLYRGREAKDPYMLTHLIKEDGRTLSIGAVEHLFDSQWMVNHSMKNMKDTLDMASKLIFQTADSNYIGRNVLTAIETGDIFVHQANMPLTRVANDKPDIQAFQGFAQQWQSLAGEITSTPDAIKGTTLPSGTPYSLGAFLGAQANSLFEIMTENKGLHVEDMMREYVIPHLKKKMDTKEEIVAVLDDNSIAEIDSMYVPKEAIRRYNKQFAQDLISGVLPQQFDQNMAESAVRRDMAPLGNKRIIKPDEVGDSTWKQALEGFEMRVTVEVTNENTDKQAVLTTLASVLQTIISAGPLLEQNPTAKMILGEILKQTSVISPLQLSTASAPTVSPPTGGTEALTELANQTNGSTQ